MYMDRFKSNRAFSDIVNRAKSVHILRVKNFYETCHVTGMFGAGSEGNQF